MKLLNDTYQSFLKSGKIIPLDFNFPSFSISSDNKEDFKSIALDIISEKIMIGIETDNYELKKYINDISFDKLQDYEKRKIYGRTSDLEDKTIGFILEKILPNKIKNDKNIQPFEINKNITKEICLRSLEIKFSELIFLKNMNLSSENLEKEEENKFIATLILMKKEIPNIYNQYMLHQNFEKDSLLILEQNIANDNYNFSQKEEMSSLLGLSKENLSYFDKIKEQVFNPNKEVIKIIYQHDEKIATELYPQYSQEFGTKEFKKKFLN